MVGSRGGRIGWVGSVRYTVIVPLHQPSHAGTDPIAALSRARPSTGPDSMLCVELSGPSLRSSVPYVRPFDADDG